MNPKNILITPLGWGLGHAGRMIPLSLRLKEMGHNITIAGNEECLSLFRNETAGMNLVLFSGFTMRYSNNVPPYITVLWKLPALIIKSLRDHRILKNLIKRYQADIVISDNRFGCWNRKIKSIYVTHQLRIIFPVQFRFLEPLGIAFHRFIINKYDLCLIPDFPGDVNLSGDLSHNLSFPPNSRYIGLLSRFTSGNTSSGSHDYPNKYITIILSGPEPQKSILRKKLIDYIQLTDYMTIILEGTPGVEKINEITGRIKSYNHLPSFQMRDIITGSDKVICRAGYTTIMELISLQKTALLIPTPGQTEQEYLAQYLSLKGWFSSASQEEKNIIGYLSDAHSDFPNDLLSISEDLLSKALSELSE
jgi:uncharacterized protein (TIGR00661 family)